MAVSFKVSRTDSALITKIVDRAALHIQNMDKMQVRMSLTACHANGCPLRLADLAEADDFNLIHDVCGIHNTVSRDTGKIEGHFLPRFAAKDATPTQRQVAALREIAAGKVTMCKRGYSAFRIDGATPQVIGKLISLKWAKWPNGACAEQVCELTETGAAILAKY